MDPPDQGPKSQVLLARGGPSTLGGRTLPAALLRRRLRLIARPVRGAAAFRIWVRGSEVAIVALAILAGGTSGLIASLMGGATHWLHLILFGPGAEHGLSVLSAVDPLTVLLVPTIGGLLLAILNVGLARWWPRAPIDPIEANALYGGRMSLADGAVVGAQNIVSNGFGASVGLEAAYTQAGSGVASWLGESFGLRRGDLRVLVGAARGLRDGRGMRNMPRALAAGDPPLKKLPAAQVL